MSAGADMSKVHIDGWLNSAYVQLRKSLEDVHRIATVLGAFTGGWDAQSTALTALGYSAEDVAAIHSAALGADQIYRVANNLAAQPTADNLLFWPNKLTGLN